MGFTAIVYYPCDNMPGITGMELDPCTEDPCQYKPGDTPTASIGFVPPTEAENANLTQSYFQEAWVALPSHDICGDSIECPIVEGEEYQMNYTLVTDGILPSGNVDFEIKLESDTKPIFCVRFTLDID